jgi:anti-sigma-K factor RskA
MIDETLQDQALDFLFGQMPPEQARQFAAAAERDPELRAFLRDLEAAAAGLVLAQPPIPPPPAVKKNLLAEIQTETRIVRPPRSLWGTLIPWAAAACAVLAAVGLWRQNERLQEIGADMRERIASLEERDDFSTMRIATLSAQVSAYEKALAIVVFDSDEQQGIVQVDQLPVPAADRDYQLWVLEPGGRPPVSAGLVPVPPGGGITRIAFKPAKAVPEIDAFAISVEPKGGSEQPRGQVVFVGK